MSGKIKLKIEDGSIVFGVDANEDGKESISGKLNLGEAVQEARSTVGGVRELGHEEATHR